MAQSVVYTLVMMTGVEEYARFSDPLFRWSSLDEFLSSSDWVGGIHVIGFEGAHFDILIRGGIDLVDDLAALPVFFTGAVSREGAVPPFFSGSTLAGQLNVPFISVADPTLALSSSLSIGWYTGEAYTEFQAVFSRFLSCLRSFVGVEPLLVGGSAGGFASLLYASSIGCDAFVWNPQTDLLKYGAWAVREYLATVLKSSSWMYQEGVPRTAVPAVDLQVARESLNAGGIKSKVDDVSAISRLIYLQNVSDRHAQTHAYPLRISNCFQDLGGGLYGHRSRFMAVGPYAEGHRAPERKIIENCLNLMLRGGDISSSGLRSMLTV